MLIRDLNYITSVLKGEEQVYQPDWYSVLGFLVCHKIEGLFYRRACKQGINLPKKIKKVLRETFERQQRKVVLMRESIKEISQRLLQKQAKHIFLKGSVLSNIAQDDTVIYEDGERTSNDIDLLVKSDELTIVEKTLYEAGFVQGEYNPQSGIIEAYSRFEIVKRRMNRGEIAPFIKLTGNKEFPFIEVDVNFSLGNTPTEGQALLKEMIDSAIIYNGNIAISVPTEELFFLHLIMHQYKESCSLFMVDRNKDLDFYKLADIYYILKETALDLRRVERLVKKYSLEQAVGAVLQQVGQAFFDKNIECLSRKFLAEQPIVIDYDSKKKYEWRNAIRSRLCTFNAKKYLMEREK